MKAISQDRYGGPEVLELTDVPEPVMRDDQVLVEVAAVSINPYDWHFMRGEPYFMRAQAGLRRPKVSIRGVDFAGTVLETGPDADGLAPGDEVFGEVDNALAERLVATTDSVARKPGSISFEEVAAIPMAGETALQGLRDHGRLQAGQRVLINGASGGIGTFAVQIAKAMGAAEVTGVCSGKNTDLVLSLGADRVIDYTKENFTEIGEKYDLILDLVSTQPWEEVRRILTDEGRVIVGGWLSMGDWVGPLGSMLGLRGSDRRGTQTFKNYLAKRSVGDIATIADWMVEGKVKSAIGRTYPMADTADAMRYLETMHAQGKVIITI
jgi:NADPH:quinone reductase-like Zn-dependent oxidoreductase